MRDAGRLVQRCPSDTTRFAILQIKSLTILNFNTGVVDAGRRSNKTSLRVARVFRVLSESLKLESQAECLRVWQPCGDKLSGVFRHA